MNTRRFFLPVLAFLGVTLAGCGFFDDPQPDFVTLRVDGPNGAPVQLHLAKNFVAGVDEIGTTQVQVFSADTVNTTLPVDTTINISVERRFFVQMLPLGADSLGVDVRIDIDDRNRYDQAGKVFASDPFRWVFLFNTRTTLVIELL